MDLNWLREELSKEQSEINWFQVVEVSKKIHDEENLNKSILGLSKGYVNFVKISSSYFHEKFAKEIKVLYPHAKINTFNSQSALNKFLKAKSDEVKEYIQNELVVLMGDKLTLETIFHRHKVPYIKFTMSDTYRQYKQKDGTKEMQNRFLFRKDGEKGFSWVKGDGLSMKRDSLLENLLEVFDEDNI